MTNDDPLRRLARESGRIAGELGVRTEDTRWIAALTADVESLTVPWRRGIVPRRLARFWRRIRRASR
jgi:hypothetical protein